MHLLQCFFINCKFIFSGLHGHVDKYVKVDYYRLFLVRTRSFPVNSSLESLLLSVLLPSVCSILKAVSLAVMLFYPVILYALMNKMRRKLSTQISTFITMDMFLEISLSPFFYHCVINSFFCAFDFNSTIFSKHNLIILESNSNDVEHITCCNCIKNMLCVLPKM